MRDLYATAGLSIYLILIIMYQIGNNVIVPMTRRYPNLKRKVLLRDSKIAEKIIHAWDINHSQTEVLGIFIKENKNLSDERYWELLRSVWIICGSIEYNDLFRKLLSSSRKEKYYFSTPEEHKKLTELPNQIEIYRATNNVHDNGLSWTISKSYAEQYKTDYNKLFILNKSINKNQIFAYINRNLEEEIIIL